MKTGYKLISLAKKLSRRSARELQTRAWQEITKRADLLRSDLGLEPPQRRHRSYSAFHARFFFSPAELPEIVALLAARFPDETAGILRQAETICQHRFDLLGYEGLEYGAEIDWHLDSASGKRAPRKPWFQIRYLDFDEVGDSKVTWELNRHQHLVTLAKAYRLTNTERYAAEIIAQWHHWQPENPYPIGINWASSLEVAFRSLSWLWVRELLAGSPAVPEAFFAELESALAVHARHIEKYLSTYFSPNTHLLGEAVALFFVGTLCPQFAASRRWQKRGWRIILEESRRQVRPDGVHFEQSIYYHVYALDFFLHARILAAANGIEIPSALDETLVKMLEFLAALGQAGAAPRLGDDDGGRLFDPRRNRSKHLLDPLSTGAVLFRRGDFKAGAGSLREETLWLLGKQAAEVFECLPDIAPQCVSRSFPESGIYILASQSSNRQQLVLDAGPHGAGSAGHGHADALSVHLSSCGQEWLADPGTGVYVSADDERDGFRGTAAHNTLQVDGMNQAEPAGTFQWGHLVESRVERRVNAESFDLAIASHTGYLRLSEPVLHRRAVVQLKSRFWFVWDLVEGRRAHRLDVHWHLGLGITAERSAGAFQLRAPGGETLALVPVEDSRWGAELEKGSISPVYGQKTPSAVLRFTRRAELPAEFGLLLLPNATAEDAASKLEHLPAASSSDVVSAYRCRIRREIHYLYFSRAGRTWQHGEWASDAEFLYCSTASDGTLERVILAGGSYLQRNGTRLLAAGQLLDHWEWQPGAEAVAVSDAFQLAVPSSREGKKAV